MLCRFKKMKTEWICPDCGRRSKISDKQYCPSAICRLPPKDPVVMKREYTKNIAKIYGIGYWLANMLKQIFPDQSFSMEALQLFQLLNNRNAKWCKKNNAYIVGELKKESRRKKIQFSKKGAEILVRLACIKAQTIPH